MRKIFCSINGAPAGRLIDEGMSQERAMLAQAETRSKAPFGHSNGRPDKSDGFNQQFQVAKLKKELTLVQREISNLKNQQHQAKENITKASAERCSKSEKDDSIWNPTHLDRIGQNSTYLSEHDTDMFIPCAYKYITT